MHGTSRLFPVFISPIAWDMCEHLHYESAYFKELHQEQEYYIQSAGTLSVNYYWYTLSRFRVDAKRKGWCPPARQAVLLRFMTMVSHTRTKSSLVFF